MRRLGKEIWQMYRVMHNSLIKDVLGVVGNWLVEKGWNARGCSAADYRNSCILSSPKSSIRLRLFLSLSERAMDHDVQTADFIEALETFGRHSSEKDCGCAK